MSSTKNQKALEAKEITPSSQGGVKEKPTTSKEVSGQQDSKETSKTQPNDLLKNGLKNIYLVIVGYNDHIDPINTSTKVNENGENQETKNSKKKTTKKQKEEINGTDQKQEVNEKNAQEGKPNPKEEEKQGSEPSNKAKKQVADKVQENNIESKESVKNKKEKKVEGSKGLEEKKLEKNETSEKSQPEKTLTIAKPKEKEAKNSTKNEKSKDQNIIRESIQLNSNNPQTDTKPKQSKQVIELKNNKSPQETQPIKDNSTQPDTLTKGNKNNKKPIPSEKPDESEIKLVSGKTLNKKETIDVSKNEDPKSKQEKQKISDEKKGLTPKNQILNDQLKKVETSEGSKTVTNKNAKPSEFSKNSRPISMAEKVENSEYTNSERRGQKNGTEKMRMRSFDAGKTDKISADDSFETRTKMWDIRKKERLLAEEKKRLRKETEECTFSPQLNQKSLSRQLSPGSIYERSVEWSSKVKATLASKGEQILEETRKPEPKKRVKSAVEHSHSESKPVKRLYNENLVPKCGVIKQNNVLPNNQGPLDIKDNITEQVSEINEMFDVITSAIKQKPLKVYKQPEPPVQKVQKQVDDNRKEPAYSYQSKPLAPKIIQPKNEPQVNRIESLKGILNLKQGDKKEKKQAPKTAPQGSENLGVILSQTKDAEVLLKKNAQHLEIRNNRYVMVDTNLSPVEKKEEEENNDISLNLEAPETNEIL